MEHSDSTYETVIGVIEMNTDNQYQDEWVPESAVVQLGSRQHSPGAIREALERAVDAGDVHRDGGDRPRYQLADGVSKWDEVGKTPNGGSRDA